METHKEKRRLPHKPLQFTWVELQYIEALVVLKRFGKASELSISARRLRSRIDRGRMQAVLRAANNLLGLKNG